MIDWKAPLRECRICPRACGIDRTAGKRGFCGAGALVRVARTMLHRWEEPCLIGAHGAGAVFFSHCTLRCVYCQNHEISRGERGDLLSVEELAARFLTLESQGAATLDLVTPTHYTPQILAALELARTAGFSRPVVWNTSGYETVETISLLNGHVDIYLPDLKYDNEESACRCSAAPGYAAAAYAALAAMVAQVGAVRFAPDGRLLSGVLVRHLVLPGHRRESIAIVRRLWETFGDAIQLSLMRQYTPTYRAAEFPPLHRKLTTFEYESVVDAVRDLGMTRVYVQDAAAVGTHYVPDF